MPAQSGNQLHALILGSRLCGNDENIDAQTTIESNR